jgi:hypothetical protein
VEFPILLLVPKISAINFLLYHKPKQDLLPFRSGNDFLARGKSISGTLAGGNGKAR